jgi:hypothetical protein
MALLFRDVTVETGITFKHTDGSSGNYYIVETVSAGLALFDYDNDGDTDIYLLNGTALKGTAYPAPPRNALYRNDGDWRFTDVTTASGLGDPGFGLGVTAGDYDNDGDLDVYVSNYGPNVLYRNDGDGTFSDVTDRAGVGDGSQVGGGTCFLDMEGDGDLDLYVANYVVFSYETSAVVIQGGVMSYAGPGSYAPASDSLYRNNGNGTFTDVTQASGIGKHAGTGMGMVCADYDNDGDTDVFVANDMRRNFLLENDGTGRFEEVGLMAGVAYDFFGAALGNMGVDCGDYDNDGRLDFYVTSYAEQWTTLYRNLGDGTFEDVTFESGSGKGTFGNATWGTGFADFDNDGDRDIFVAVGHLEPNVEKYDDRVTYLARNEVLENGGDGRFVNVTEACGDGLKVKLSSRGAGLDDLDNDGDTDVVILNSRREATVLRNDTVNGNHWLQVRLRGVRSNRDGVGAHVRVVAGGRVQMDEVHSGRSYQGHHGLRLHFGLGRHERADRVEVRWIGGTVDVVQDIPADRCITITEGKNRAR